MQTRQISQAEPAEANVLEEFLLQHGITAQQAAELLEALLEKQNALLERARAVVTAMDAIGDEDFTPETLRANPEAMRALEDGMSAGEVYRRFFLRKGAQGELETEANLGLEGFGGGKLTPDEIERISEYVSRTGRSYSVNE